MAPPLIGVTKGCSPQFIEIGQTVTFSGIVTNRGTIVLTNVTVTDTLLNSVIAIVPYLGPGGMAPFSAKYTNSDTICTPRTLTNTVIASGASFCNPGQITVATNSCTFAIQCPAICVTKQIACFVGTNAQGSEVCDTFHKFAIGVEGDTQDPAFCYHITVTNCGPVDLTNVTVLDDKFGDFTRNIFAGAAHVLPAGAVLTYDFKAELGGASTPNTTAIVTNTVIVNGRFYCVFCQNGTVDFNRWQI